MSKYETLIFDLDDTLIDNNESIKYAFKIIVDKLDIPYSDELFYKWKSFDIEYWHGWESDKIPIPKSINNLEDKITFLRARRFQLFFKDIDFSISDAIDINDLYCDMLGENIVEIDSASTLLKDLNNDFDIYVATNGPKKAAVKKIERVNLQDYVTEIVSSEEAGFSKPREEYFNYLYEKIRNKDKSKMLLVGDSLTTDILCGMINNIDTCWFNPKNKELPDEYKPTHTINKLLELKKKIK